MAICRVLWRAATAVPGIAKLNTGESAIGTVISCAAPGYCALGGNYQATSGGYELPFIDSEVNGTWGAASPVPGNPVARGNYGIAAISCPTPGDCVAAGDDDTGSSCPVLGYCVTGGDFFVSVNDSTAYSRGLVVSETAGAWGTAQIPPVLAKLDSAAFSEVMHVACATAATCVAVGTYHPSGYDEDGFLSAELPLQPTKTALHLSLAHVTPGKEQAAKITVSVAAFGSTPGAVPIGKVTVRAGSATPV